MVQRKRSHEESEATEDHPRLQTSASQTTNGPAGVNATNGVAEVIAAPVNNGDDGWQVVESKQAKRRKKMPKKTGGNYPEISLSSQARLHSFIKVTDLRDLALYLLADGFSPQWCSVKHHSNVRKVVILMVPGLEAGLFDGSVQLQIGQHQNGNGSSIVSKTSQDQDHPKSIDSAASGTAVSQALLTTPDNFYPKKLDHDAMPKALQPLAEIFDLVWPIKTPGDNKSYRMHSPLSAVLMVSIGKEEKRINKTKGAKPPAEAASWKNSPTRITEFLASTAELTEEGFVLHPASFDVDSATAERYAQTRILKGTSIADGWLDTPDIAHLADGDVPEAEIEQGSRTAGRNILAIDCEMCITSPKDVQPQEYSLTRLSVIDWNGDVVLDEFVKPEKEITDYLTPYSGITPQRLEGVTTTLSQAQQLLLSKMSPRTILVGHSLNSDLAALKIAHPYIIDTTLIYPHPRGPPLKSSLKWLAQKYLSRQIQTGHGSTGHDSIEDAQATLDLVKQKCEKGKLWGTMEASQESIFARLSRALRSKRHKLQPDGPDEPKVGAVVDWGEPTRGYGSSAATAIGCKTDADVVAGIKKVLACEQLVENGSIPTDGVDLVWARMRELDAYRGFWNSSKTDDVDSLREASIASNKDNELADVVTSTVDKIRDVWNSLPPCTAFMVYSGSGNGTTSTLAKLLEKKQKHKSEYLTKKWDELSVNWTDADEASLRSAFEVARTGVAFISVK